MYQIFRISAVQHALSIKVIKENVPFRKINIQLTLESIDVQLGRIKSGKVINEHSVAPYDYGGELLSSHCT